MCYLKQDVIKKPVRTTETLILLEEHGAVYECMNVCMVYMCENWYILGK